MTLFRALPARHLSTFFGQYRLTGLWQGRNRHHQVYIDATENKNHWDINKKGLSFITTRRVQEIFCIESYGVPTVRTCEKTKILMPKKTLIDR